MTLKGERITLQITNICRGEAEYVGHVVADKRRKGGIEMALRHLPAARLPRHFRVEPEETGGVCIHMREGNGLGRVFLGVTAVFGLTFLVLLGLGAPAGVWVIAVGLFFWLVWFLFAGFHTWRLRPG